MSCICRSLVVILHNIIIPWAIIHTENVLQSNVSMRNLVMHIVCNSYGSCCITEIQFVGMHIHFLIQNSTNFLASGRCNVILWNLCSIDKLEWLFCHTHLEMHAESVSPWTIIYLACVWLPSNHNLQINFRICMTSLVYSQL